MSRNVHFQKIRRGRYRRGRERARRGATFRELTGLGSMKPDDEVRDPEQL